MRVFAAVFLLILGLGAPARAQTDSPEEALPVYQLAIATVPRVSGMVVVVDGQPHTSGADGLIRVQLSEGTHRLEPREVVAAHEGTRYLYLRWNDTYSRIREVEMRRDRTLQLGVLVQYEIQVDYVDGLGRPFDVDRIQSALLINSNGDLTTVSGEVGEDEDGLEIGSTSRIWMTSNRVRRTGAGLLSKEAVYSAREVFVDGLNVVQSGRVEYLPVFQGRMRLPLRMYDLLVDVRSFGANRAVDGVIGIRRVGEEEPFGTSQTQDGIAQFTDLPVGDFELTVVDGGWAPAAPVVFSGPKTEVLTVVTPWVLWFGTYMLVVGGLSFLVFMLRPRWRVRILVAWVVAFMLVMNAPAIGALGGRPLSVEVTPIFGASGEFVGVDAVVENSSPFPISQVYCKPDFEFRVLSGGGVWSASYESHDFHDVEFGDCREHRVRPGVAKYRMVPAQGQEWVAYGSDPLPAGEYLAYIRLFDIPAPAIRLELTEGIDPAAGAFLVLEDPTLGAEIPFTSPFED